MLSQEEKNLRELIDNSLTLERNQDLKQSIESKIESFSKEKRLKIIEILLHEAEYLEKTYEEHDKAMAELEKSIIEKIKNLMSEGKRVIRENDEIIEKKEDKEEAEELLQDL